MSVQADRFAFGKNWSDYVRKHFAPQRIEDSRKRLLETLQIDSLQNSTFLDIGCGSGLHSLAALKSGASKIVSFDYDVDSVQTAKKLREWAGNPDNWTITQGSVLDKMFMQSLGKFDIVYSWGVLHHTGDMWSAIRNARIPLANNGVFFIALYSYVGYQSGSISGWPTPERWLEIKQKYNKAGSLEKIIMEMQQVWRSSRCWQATSLADAIRQLILFLERIRTYSDKRGMSYWTDLKDWLGGWPMEFMKEPDCLHFCREELGLELLSLKTGEGNTEYIYRPKGTTNYWDTILAQRKYHHLNGPFAHERGFMWSASLATQRESHDDTRHPKRSPIILCEDGAPLAYAHSPLAAIQHFGHGRYSHCDGKLYFSASDNKNPNTKHETYTYFIDHQDKMNEY